MWPFRPLPAVTAALFLVAGCDGSPTVPDAAVPGPQLNQSPNGAGPPLTGGSGTGTVTARTAPDVRSAGPNTILEFANEGDIFGPLEGTFVQPSVRVVVHGTTGLITFQTTGEITGTIQGCGDGTFAIKASGRFPPGEPSETNGRFVATKATTGIVVAGTFSLSQVQGTPDFTYDVRYVCKGF